LLAIKSNCNQVTTHKKHKQLQITTNVYKKTKPNKIKAWFRGLVCYLTWKWIGPILGLMVPVQDNTPTAKYNILGRGNISMQTYTFT